MTLTIKRQITAKTRYYDGENPVNYITIHETANTSVGADAQAHANLQSRGNVRLASWHWSVDDTEAIQSYEDFRRCWHAGDGRGKGNYESVGIEICENSDGDIMQAYRNAAELTAKLMKEHGVPITRVVQHNHWSGKNCPNDLRGDNKGMSWAEFIALVAEFADIAPAKPKPPVEVKPKPEDDKEIDEDGYWGTDTTTALQRILGTPVDGEVWNQNVKWEDDNPGLTYGWKWTSDPKGSKVIAAMQRKLKVDDDGLIGPDTINALSKRYGIKGDGHLDGPSITIKAMQKALNDGKF